MAWYDWLSGKGEIEAVAKPIGRALGIPNASQRREQQNLMNEQMKAYREQTELTRKQLDETRSQVAAEKRRVEEKQIRGLRRNYAPQGFLGTPQSTQPGMTDKLGG